VKVRTAQANQIRGLLGEFGLIGPQGIGHIASRGPELIGDAERDLARSFRVVAQRLLDHLKELGRHVDEIEMNNLINSTQAATLFLDAHFGVRRFTPAAARLIKLIPRDLGQPITDLVSALDYPELADDAREVLRILVASVRDVPASDGRRYAAHLMPHRTQNKRIDGVVITFSDIAMAKALERTLHASQQLARHAAGPNSEPDATRQLNTLLRRAHDLPNKRFADQQQAFVSDGAWLLAAVVGSDPR
jgi:transcriptional regulator with PAS, ATPase and Fis domain